MITARNYAAQAEHDLLYFAARTSFKISKASAIQMATDIRSAVHFVIPDGATILGDGLKGIAGQEVRLPFPIVTVEYYISKEAQAISGDEFAITKRLILAKELTYGQIVERCPTAHNTIFSEGGVHITYMGSARAITEKGRVREIWTPGMLGIIVPFRWDASYGVSTIKLGVEHVPGGENITLVNIPDLTLFSDILMKTVDDEGPQGTLLNDALNDVGGEARCLYELLEALSCKNVSTEPLDVIDPKVNARRVRNGKLPLYETRVLVVNTQHTGYPKAVGPGGGSHASPRQHLRRGHIRRLEKGNIWINACVVGDPVKGYINKQYRVK